MSEAKKSIYAAGGVVAAAVMVVLGSNHRDKIDLGGADAGVPLGGLVASREKQVNVPATDFFHTLSDKLKREYVEPVSDEMKLATGAVRGMVGSLADPKSLYMDKDEFRAFLNARQGRYEGIGADFVLKMPTTGAKTNKEYLQPTPNEESGDPSAPAPVSVNGASEPAIPEAPRLMVASIVPGGPADKAGVLPGDIVETVDGHWVYNSSLLRQFKEAQKKYQAKKMTLLEINALRSKLRAKYEKAVLPLRAKDKLALGQAGTVKVVWERGKALRTTDIVRGVSERPGFRVEGDTIRLPFVANSAARLKEAIAGKDAVTIDLRQNVVGDFGAMRQCLATVAPSGDYGVLVNERKGGDTALRIANGNANPPKITLLTDATTRGPAEVFALALSSKGIAKLSGSPTGGDRTFYDVIQLPDGSGYTLATAEYRPKPNVAKTTVAVKGGRP
ncbi:MAG: S41 family peptidase [Fimbriimonas sp.]